MGVIAATVVLSLAGRLEGNTTGAILSGIVGYVLGQLSTPTQRHVGEKEKSDAHPCRKLTVLRLSVMPNPALKRAKARILLDPC